MIAADSSSLSAFFGGGGGPDVALVETALRVGDIRLPPLVVTELLSDPKALPAMIDTVSDFLLLTVLEGYWHRAGALRRILKQKGHKAKIADTLIAQSCIDHDVALITRDGDFRHFAKYCGLKLA